MIVPFSPTFATIVGYLVFIFLFVKIRDWHEVLASKRAPCEPARFKMYYVIENEKDTMGLNFVTHRYMGHMTSRCVKREPQAAPLENLDKNSERRPHSTLDGVPPFTRLEKDVRNETKT